jgi:two-component system response regulator
MKTTTAHKILIVDDNPDDIEITKIILRRMGHALKVEEAPSGEAALKRLMDGKDLPSIILLDIKMPGMNGIETLRLIRADENLKNIYVIVLTNSSLESDRRAALEAGTDSFLHKSFNMERFGKDLMSILERWLEG